MSGLILSGLILLAFFTGSLLILHFLVPGLTPADFFAPDRPYVYLVQILVLLAFCLIAGILLHISFRKTSSAEIFFFFLFLFLTSLEGTRLLILAVNLRELPFENAAALSRLVYFCRYLGTLCLFTSGLFASGLQYQRMEAVLGICALVAFSLAVTLPLDTGGDLHELLFRNSLERQFSIGFLIIQLFAVGNYFYAGWLNNNRNYHVMALGMALVLTGRELLFRQSSGETGPLLALTGMLLLFLGTAVFGKRTHEVYLWF